MIAYGLVPESPLGSLWLAAGPEGLMWLQWGGGEAELRTRLEHLGAQGAQRDDGAIADAGRQLSEYFAGGRRDFNVDIDWTFMPAFQARVLQLTAAIPYGEVRTYGQLARDLGLSAGAARAVGRANATNPLPIIIPCHRVVAADGSLRGYGGPGGVRTKAWLLALERRNQPTQLALPLGEAGAGR